MAKGTTFEVNDAVARANAINKIEKKKKKLNFARISLDDKKTWDMICSGMTKGVFQVEKQLGKRYCKEIAPRSIEELSDVLSLIRPGCLEAPFREKPEAPGEYSSITNTYIKIKNGAWAPEYIHPSLEPILCDTYGVPVYQEQIMKICTDFAGFTLKEADVARKAIGKKKADVMKKVKKQFLDGAASRGHDAETAETIFSWIDKFSGYGFNKSHGVSYAMNSYRTAYAKANYPLEFFKAMLTNSEGKQDSLEEIQELVHEARYFGIEVKPPCLRNMNIDFIMDSGGTITFGLGHIKGVGKSAIGGLERAAKSKNSIEFLRHAFALCSCCKKTKIRSNVAEALIKSGAVDYLGSKRIPLLAQYKMLAALTARERVFVFERVENAGRTVAEAVDDLLSSKVPNKARRPRIVEKFKQVNKELGGNAKKMCIAYEKHFLGIPLSGSLVELYYNPTVDIKCANLGNLAPNTRGNMGVVLDKIKFHKDKNHNDMAFLTVSDETYFCDNIVVFASFFNKVAWILEEGKPVLISGKKSKTGGFIVQNITHL